MKNLSFVLALFLSVSFMATSLNAQSTPSCCAKKTACAKKAEKSTATTMATAATTKKACASSKTACTKTKTASTKDANTATAQTVGLNNVVGKVNCDPANCDPANCDPKNCPPGCDISKCTKSKKAVNTQNNASPVKAVKVKL